ncbi:hypothetical protein D3C81_2057250 [compost metagenome]
MPGKLVQLCRLLRQQLLRLGQQPPRILQGLLDFQAQALLLELGIEVFQGAQAVTLHTLEALQGRQIGF